MEQKQSILEVLKEKKSTYIFNSPEGRILFSLLSIEDYTLIKRISLQTPALIPELEEEIWDKCVIEHSFGTELFGYNAGVVTTLAQIVMKLSCPTDLEGIQKDIEEARDNISEISEQLILKVCEAFPSYTPEEVQKFEWSTLMKRVAQAELILNKEVEFKSTSSNIKETESAPMIEKDGQAFYDFDAVIKEFRET